VTGVMSLSIRTNRNNGDETGEEIAPPHCKPPLEGGGNHKDYK